MKTKQITALLLLVCIILTPVLTSSASAHTYDYVYTNASVLTPDSFEDVFGGAELDRAAYTYEIIDFDNDIAFVAMELELKIGHDYYNARVSGAVNVYILPSGDKLYKGPINGNMMIEEDIYQITVGFVKLGSTDDASLSITLQRNSDMIIVSFLDNIIQGEVLDFLMGNATNVSENVDDSEITINNFSDLQYVQPQEDTTSGASTMAITPPPGFPIINPGPEYENLGNNGKYVYQDSGIAFLGNSTMKGLETRVYWYRNAGSMLVTVHPKVDNAVQYVTERYLYTGLFDVMVYAVLDSFEISLRLPSPYGDDNFVESQQAAILGLGVVDNYLTGNSSMQARYFSALVFDLLEVIDVPTEVLSTIIQDMRGRVNATHTTYNATITVDMSVNAQNLEELRTGLPLYFDLIRPNPESYTGNTPYQVTTTAMYEAVFGNYGDSTFPALTLIYVPCTVTHNGGNVTLGPV